MAFPQFSATARTLDGYAVVSVGGELDMATAPQLEEVLAHCNNGTPIIVDCRRLTFLDSHGLRVLFEERSAERRALVVERGSHIRRVIDIVDAHHHLPVFPTLAAAVLWAHEVRP